MIIGNLAFFIFILIASIYIFFIKSKSSVLERYLSFVMVNSFFLVLIFDIQSALWITLISAFGLILDIKSPIRDKIIVTFIVIFLFVSLRVPTNPAEFETYLIEEHGIHCSALECLELVEVVSDDMRQMQATNYSIQDLNLDWHFFYAQGEIRLNNKSIKAINVAGFWFQIK